MVMTHQRANKESLKVIDLKKQTLQPPRFTMKAAEPLPPHRHPHLPKK